MTIVTVGIELAKNVFAIHGADEVGKAALVAATSDGVSHFKDARHFSNWFGLTPKEYSSGNCRHLGRISKRGDRYLRELRVLRTHGARSVLRASKVADNAGREVCRVRRGAPDVLARLNRYLGVTVWCIDIQGQRDVS